MRELWKARSPIDLVGNHINVATGEWTATDAGIGAGVDSYFEYLAKGAFLFQRPNLMQQFLRSLPFLLLLWKQWKWNWFQSTGMQSTSTFDRRTGSCGWGWRRAA